jgi:hypothetical protein
MKTTGYGFPVRNLFSFATRLRRFFPPAPNPAVRGEESLPSSTSSKVERSGWDEDAPGLFLKEYRCFFDG